MGSIFIPLTQSANLQSPYKHLAQVACNLYKLSTVKVIESTQTFTWDYVNSARNSILIAFITHKTNRHPNRVYTLMYINMYINAFGSVYFLQCFIKAFTFLILKMITQNLCCL